MANKEDVMEVLRQIEDPELRKPLTDLDMIKSVEINDGQVSVDVLLTVPGCPLKKKITDDITEKVGQLKGVKKVEVNLGVMSDEQRKNLTAKVYGKDHRRAAPVSDKPTPIAGDFAKRVIGVASGKGGVGKSTITANLALAPRDESRYPRCRRLWFFDPADTGYQWSADRDRRSYHSPSKRQYPGNVNRLFCR